MVVSEIGVNHKGSMIRASVMLKKLLKTSVDAITFQISKPELYDKNKTFGRPLTGKFYTRAIELAHKNNKLIGFAIADIAMIPFLNARGADFWKTLSSDISNYKLQNELQKTKKTVFISTGLSGEEEIIRAGEKFKNIKFIHTQLSSRIEDANLSAIKRIRAITGKDTAFGLHCADHRVLYLSLAFDPSDIFFYIKEKAGEKYPDDEHAILIKEIDRLIKGMGGLRRSVGSGVKRGNRIR